VDQFQIQTNGYSALFEGQGVENFSIKSGNNTYHGYVYDLIRNTAFDAWGFFAPALINPYAGHPTKPTEHENEYGIVLSGPVIKDKLFYFGDYTGYRFTHAAHGSDAGRRLYRIRYSVDLRSAYYHL
jgi:hypothetical protein